MRISTTRKRRSTFRTIALALGLAVVTATLATGPARADNDDWRHSRERNDWRHERDHRDRDWRGHREGEPSFGFYFGPSYNYAPPPVVYAPPPSGVSIVVPLNIR